VIASHSDKKAARATIDVSHEDIILEKWKHGRGDVEMFQVLLESAIALWGVIGFG
jgi:hypothetical protein